MNQGRIHYLLLHTHLLNSLKCHTPPPGLMALFLLNCLGHILDLTILLDDGDTAGALGQRGQVTTQSETKDNQGQEE